MKIKIYKNDVGGVSVVESADGQELSVGKPAEADFQESASGETTHGMFLSWSWWVVRDPNFDRHLIVSVSKAAESGRGAGDHLGWAVVRNAAAFRDGCLVLTLE